MKKINQFSFKDNIIILVLIIFSIAYSITVATNFTFEPSYVSSNTGYFDKYKDKLNLTENIRGHREFLGGAAGDAIHYFALALGKDDVSHPPYTTRLLFPKLAGFLAKSSFIFDKTVLTGNNDILFTRISLVNRFLNIFFCFLLVAIPFWVFRKIIFFKSCPISISVLPLLNVVNIGVIMTAPFFMVDISLYVLFTFAAYFFFRQKTYKLFLLVCVSLLAKEISLVLLIPLYYCVAKEKKNFYKKLFIIILPLLIYFLSRQIISGGFLELGQLRYNIFEDPFDFYYLKYHLNIQWGIFNFITRASSSVGIIFLISFYIFSRFRVSQDKFLVVLFMCSLVIILNILLASGVLRVVQVVTPFFIFYILYSYENICKKLIRLGTVIKL